VFVTFRLKEDDFFNGVAPSELDFSTAELFFAELD
jgi:hypothetical protein